jgi:hypothetical protein
MGTMQSMKLYGFVFNVLFPYMLLPAFLLFLGYVLFFIWPAILPRVFNQP